MKKGICFLGVVIILASFVIFAQYQVITELVENPAYRQWLMQQVYSENPTLENAPPQHLRVYYNIYPYTVLGAVVLLIGFVTLIIGFAMPEK